MSDPRLPAARIPALTAGRTRTALRRWGGAAALIEAATYLFGFALIATVLSPLAGELDAAAYLTLLEERFGLLYVWNLTIYVVNGAFLAVLVVALHELLVDDAPLAARFATAFGLIWSGLVIASGMLILHDLGVVAELAARDPAQAVTVWTALQAVENGLGGGVELPGGLWVLLVSAAAARTRALPRPLVLLGGIAGAAGVLTLLPTTDVFEAVFGLGMILWFLGVGVALLRVRSATAPAASAPSVA